MCGLCGVAGNLTVDDTKVFNDLMIVSQLRGTDSTGLASVKYNGDVRVIKDVGDAMQFLDRTKVKSELWTDKMALIGHTRFMTSGKLNRECAQPFDLDNIVGTHNGTLSMIGEYNLAGKDKYATDSLALMTYIDKNGLKQALDKLNQHDAMALVWFDKLNYELNFYRNDQRTFFYAFNKKHDVIYWASEAGMLYLVLNKKNIVFDKVQKLDSFKHFQLVMPNKAGEKFEKPIITKIEMRKPPEAPKPVKKEENAGFFREWSAANRAVLSSAATGIVSTVGNSAVGLPATAQTSLIRLADYQHLKDKEKFKLSILTHRSDKDGGDFYHDDNKNVISHDEFDKRCKNGCCCCGAFPQFGEAVKFLSRSDDIICSDCMAEAASGKSPDMVDLVGSML